MFNCYLKFDNNKDLKLLVELKEVLFHKQAEFLTKN